MALRDSFCTACLSVYLRFGKQCQVFSFDLDQPLFLVSWLFELPGKDGSEGDIPSSLVGKQLGVSGKPGKIRFPSYNGT